MKYQAPAIVDLGCAEDLTLGGDGDASQDSNDTYYKKHGDPNHRVPTAYEVALRSTTD